MTRNENRLLYGLVYGVAFFCCCFFLAAFIIQSIARKALFGYVTEMVIQTTTVFVRDYCGIREKRRSCSMYFSSFFFFFLFCFRVRVRARGLGGG